jgi:glutamyl-tRNA synthetase
VAFCEFLFKDTILLEKSNLSIEGKSESEVGEIIHQVWLLLDNILDWTTETLQKTTEDFMDKYGLTPKQLYSVVREAISGQRVTPPLFESMVVLGREETLARLGQAMVILGAK